MSERSEDYGTLFVGDFVWHRLTREGPWILVELPDEGEIYALVDKGVPSRTHKIPLTSLTVLRPLRFWERPLLRQTASNVVAVVAAVVMGHILIGLAIG